MEDKWIDDEVNGAKIICIDGNSYIDLADYLALLKEYKALQKEKAEG
mgnify:CR=1 FL=1